MKRLIISFVLAGSFVFTSTALALPPGALPPPEFEKRNFLLTANIPEMNVDFAIAWTDSAAGLLSALVCGATRAHEPTINMYIIMG